MQKTITFKFFKYNVVLYFSFTDPVKEEQKAMDRLAEACSKQGYLKPPVPIRTNVLSDIETFKQKAQSKILCEESEKTENNEE